MVRGLRPLLHCTWISAIALILVGEVASDPSCAARAQGAENLDAEYVRLRAVNAVLKARLSLSQQTEPYLILDLPGREVGLELQGVTLTRVPVRKVSVNRLAAEIADDTAGIGFCEVPFVLGEDRWFEEVPTLAVKDTAAIMSHPDTTGALVERIRTTPVLSLLRFDRNLVVALNGYIQPTSRIEGWKRSLRLLWRSLKSKTPEGILQSRRGDSVLLELELEPAQVRSLAPNLTHGTKMVLRF